MKSVDYALHPPKLNFEGLGSKQVTVTVTAPQNSAVSTEFSFFGALETPKETQKSKITPRINFAKLVNIYKLKIFRHCHYVLITKLIKYKYFHRT